MPNRSIILGKLLLTTCGQAGAAPVLDHGNAVDSEGRSYPCRVLLLTPWRRNQYRESLPQRAFVIGWRGQPVWWNRWRPKRIAKGPFTFAGIAEGATPASESTESAARLHQEKPKT